MKMDSKIPKGKKKTKTTILPFHREDHKTELYSDSRLYQGNTLHPVALRKNVLHNGSILKCSVLEGQTKVINSIVQLKKGMGLEMTRLRCGFMPS